MPDGTRDTDADWQALAETEPYWAVLSESQYKSETLDEATLASFWESGERYVADLLGAIHKHFDPNFRAARIMDVGCGVGRLLIPFAAHASERAVGVDVAPQMLALCQQNLSQRSIANVDLCKSDDGLTEVDGEFDLVNCYIVLQHIPPQRGYRLIQAMLDKLAPGGIASIQVTYGKSRRFLQHEAATAEFYRREGDRIVDILPTFWAPPPGTVTMFDYDLHSIMALVSRTTGTPIMTFPTGDDGHLGVHLLFAKRAAQ